MLNEPRKLIFIGAVLLTIGWTVPMLMVLKIITPTFLLGFLSYAASLAGLVMGLIGIFTHFRPERRR